MNIKNKEMKNKTVLLLISEILNPISPAMIEFKKKSKK